jgi:hypothetical protein
VRERASSAQADSTLLETYNAAGGEEEHINEGKHDQLHVRMHDVGALAESPKLSTRQNEIAADNEHRLKALAAARHRASRSLTTTSITMKPNNARVIIDTFELTRSAYCRVKHERKQVGGELTVASVSSCGRAEPWNV